MRCLGSIFVVVCAVFCSLGCDAGSGSRTSSKASMSDVQEARELPACTDFEWTAETGKYAGTTLDASDSVGAAPCVQTGTDGSKDAVIHFRAERDGRFTFSTAGSDFDTVLHLRRSTCDGEVLACNDDYSSAHSQITLEMQAGEAVLAIIDGFNREEGEVAFSVVEAETECSDDLDNDGDGEADCDDADCFLFCEAPEDWPAEWAQLEDEAVVETNRARNEARRCDDETFEAAPPVKMNRFVQYAARLHSRAMGRESFFEHDSPDGRTFSDRMRQAGFTGALPWGENIAAGQNTAAEVVQTWVDSPDHCKNLMNPNFTIIGIGFAIVPDTEFTEYWTQDFAAGE